MISPGLPLNGRQRAVRAVTELLGSMRFAIALLVVLAIASVIGTVLTQNDPYPNYVNQFGPFWADIFRSLGLYTVYSAWWFILILGFLIVSISLCVIRNAPKMIADIRSWKDQVHEASLRAFHHKREFNVPGQTREQVASTLAKLAGRLGYRFAARDTEGATLIAAKRGALAKAGYIFAHLAIVAICIGGLLDSNLPIRMQMWLFSKTPVSGDATVNEIAPTHRLSASNPTFRGYAWVPEGQDVSAAILNQPDGSLIQDLPFSIHLNRFTVDYYSTGMPRQFTSEIVVTDHRSGKRIPARIEVNRPFEYEGVSIYQSSFEDGGSQLTMTGWPMTGARAGSFAFSGTIGRSAPLTSNIPGTNGQVIEFVDFRAINVENVSSGGGATDVRSVAHRSMKEVFDERLGSGAKTSKPLDLHNIGPSIQYRVRDRDGQAHEYNSYMLPVNIDGASMFLAGMRTNTDDSFRYLRIPADSHGTVKEWMLLRAAFRNPKLRAQAAHRFAQRSANGASTELRQSLEESALRVLTLFAGNDGIANGQETGGFQAIATFIDHSVPAAGQERAADLFLRMLESVTWDLWQVAREQAGEPVMQPDAQSARFVQDAINAVSDSFLYGSPVFLQLDSFTQVQASVFQLTRTPGKKIVYLGSLLLVLGIFSMFYVRERRLWFWLTEDGYGVRIIMAMSAARRTLDFEKEFTRVRNAVGRALDAPPAAGHGADGTHGAKVDIARQPVEIHDLEQ